MSKDFDVSAPSLAKLAKELRATDKLLLKKLRDGLRNSASPALERARANASWSKRIPRATTISMQFPARGARVRLRVNAQRAPHARAYEGVGGDTFRRRVYGKAWVEQRTRPFLIPAAKGQVPAVRAEMRRVADEIAAAVTR